MNEAVVKIFEACNFQDLTGQRITKVVRALSFIEERVEAMMGVWNKVNQRRRHLFRRSVQAEFSWRRENNGGLDG
jgi:chemotaxis regulatin CheY-phosphate phosphatase CheZ